MADFEVYDKICEEMKSKGFEKTDGVISAAYAQTVGLLVPIPLMIILGSLYYLRWGKIELELYGRYWFYMFIGLCITIIIHEIIHGITWSCFCEEGFRNISFGFTKGMPYCHCNVALKKKEYIAGAIAPLLVLGGLLFVITLFNQSTTLFILMLLNIWGAGGDLLILMKAVKLNNSAYIIDHPNLPGFVAFIE